MKRLVVWCDMSIPAVVIWDGAFEDTLEEARRLGVESCWAELIRIGEKTIVDIMFAKAKRDVLL